MLSFCKYWSICYIINHNPVPIWFPSVHWWGPCWGAGRYIPLDAASGRIRHHTNSISRTISRSPRTSNYDDWYTAAIPWTDPCNHHPDWWVGTRLALTGCWCGNTNRPPQSSNIHTHSTCACWSSSFFTYHLPMLYLALISSRRRSSYDPIDRLIMATKSFAPLFL